MVRKVGKWEGSSYSRYKIASNRKSGIEYHNRYKNPIRAHPYGADPYDKGTKLSPIKQAVLRNYIK